MFERATDNHRYLTSNSSTTSVKLSSVKTNYGRNSICFKSCTQWNKIMKELNSEKIQKEKREGKYWNKQIQMLIIIVGFWTYQTPK